MINLRIVGVLVIISLWSINSLAQSHMAGEWSVGEQNTIVKIEQEDGIYTGKIVASDNPKVKIGNPMIKELKQIEGTWKGKVYSPKRKEWYDAEFTQEDNKLNLEIKVGIFSKTLEWTRI